MWGSLVAYFRFVWRTFTALRHPTQQLASRICAANEICCVCVHVFVAAADGSDRQAGPPTLLGAGVPLVPLGLCVCRCRCVAVSLSLLASCTCGVFALALLALALLLPCAAAALAIGLIRHAGI